MEMQKADPKPQPPPRSAVLPRAIHQTAYCPGCRRQVFAKSEGGLPNTVILAIKNKKNSTADEQDERR